MLTKKSSEAAKNSWHYFSPLAAIAACFLITATTNTRSALLRLWCSGTSIGERMPRIWADWNGFPAFGVMAQST
jgi:hypothetical protein